MNKPMLAAATISATTVALHVIGGGNQIHTPIQGSDLSLELRTISAILWHFVTLVLVLQTVGFGWISRQRSPDLAVFLCALQLGFAALFLAFGLAILGTIWVFGQWTIFLTIAAFALWGMRK